MNYLYLDFFETISGDRIRPPEFFTGLLSDDVSQPNSCFML